MQPIEVQNVIVIVLMFLDHVQHSRTQDVMFPALPLGQFRFVSTFPFGVNPTSSSTNQFLQPDSVLDRPRIDQSVPAGVDAAAIAAQGDAIVAFINTCPRQMSLAYLRCPCSNPGGRCADAYSVCSLENKCACNGRLSYADSSGTRCIPYATSTTNLPTTRTTTTPPTTRTTTRTTTTTTATSTTTVTTTTTKPPTILKDCPGGTVDRTLATSDTIEIVSGPVIPQGTVFSCDYVLDPPLEKSLKLDIEALDLPPGEFGCSSYVKISGSGNPALANSICGPFNPLPSTYIFPAGSKAEIIAFIDEANLYPYSYKLKISVV